MNSKTIGITGHSGCLGKELIKKFTYDVTIDKFLGDITKKKDIQFWLKNKKFDAIFHLAAIVPTLKVEKYYYSFVWPSLQKERLKILLLLSMSLSPKGAPKNIITPFYDLLCKRSA